MQQLQAAMGSHASKGSAPGKGAGGGKGLVPVASTDPKAREPGAWTCPHCGNLNYAGRAFCNAKSCGRPAPYNAHASYAPAGYGYAPSAYCPPARAGASPYGYATVPVYASPLGAGGKVQRPPPEGSWECTACHNINWPTRE